MPRLGNRVPKYRKHKQSGQAIVTINGRDCLLGPYGTKASKVEYDRLITEWLTAGRSTTFGVPEQVVSVVELIVAYLDYAKAYYGGGQRGEYANMVYAVRPLRELYGRHPAREFGPLQLKSVREKFIAAGNSRKHINQQIRRIGRVFRWSAAEGLIPPDVPQTLAMVPGLRKGHTTAKETQRVRPVNDQLIEATLPFLPSDLGECQRLLLAAFQQASELERVLDETAASYAELKETHQAAIDELDRLKRWIYGRRSERIIEGQGQQHLFDLQPPTTATTEESLQQPLRSQVTGHSRRRRRELDLDKLPHYRHELDLQAVDKICTCCGRAKDRIGEDQTKILDYVPPKLEVHVHVRPKYACRYCKDGVVSPPPPERPIARGIAGPGLIAQIVVSKFGDHLPLYRQEDFFTRHGLHIARSTQCDWVRAAAEILRPLYERQKELVLQSPVLWTDDTPITVLTGSKEGSRQGRFWAYIGEEHPYSVYDFTVSRARDGPARFLAGFQGYLHADAYGGYDHIYLGSNESVLEVACWAHARRKFFEAINSSPREAHRILEWVRQLYDIEDQARTWSPSARASLRKKEAEPVLDRIEAYLVELGRRALPKSILGKAVSYAQNQWQALRRYTADGRLTIDNNVSERTLRHQAIGRNYVNSRIMLSVARMRPRIRGRSGWISSHNHRPSKNCISGFVAAGREGARCGDLRDANAFFFDSRSACRY